MRTDHIEPIAETMDRVGYKAIGTVGGNGYVIQVRNLDEDPWERVRMLSRALKRTTIRGSYQIWGLADFEQTTPRDIITLWIKRCVANGIKSFWVCDYQTDMEKFAYFARIAKAEGAEVCVALVYASSPVHTNEHWAHKTRLIAEVKDCVDAIVIGDPGGVLTPENVRGFLATVQKNCDGIPIEFQAQCSSGLASQTYVEAMKAGVTTMQTAVAPLANGTSMPSTESVIKNARRLGFETDLDEDALAAESEHFRKISETEGFPLGMPMDYDLFYFEHQVPGGMMTNLTRQLREVKMEHRLDEILNEVVKVRKDFGYPVMATPYSQIVGAQAVDNVVSGERYKQVSDSTIKYVLGFYGEPVGPMDQNFVDKVMNSQRTKEFLNWKPVNWLRSVEEIRSEVGGDLSDDELLLKSLIPGRPMKRGEAKKQVQAHTAKRPTPVSFDSPQEFTVEVDGESYRVRVSPSSNGSAHAPEAEAIALPKEAKPGSIPSGMAGLVLSYNVGVGDTVSAGDLVAIIEAMKMRRQVLCPHGGVVQEICTPIGEIVDPEDILLVVV